MKLVLQICLTLLTLNCVPAQEWKTLFLHNVESDGGASILIDPFDPSDSPANIFVGIEGGADRLLKINRNTGEYKSYSFTNTYTIRALAFEPVSSNLFAGFAIDGWLIYRSIDRGDTWAEVDRRAGLGSVQGFAIDESGGIYAAGNTRATFNATSVALVRKSSDGGQTWGNVYEAAGGQTPLDIKYVPGPAGGLFTVGGAFLWTVRRSRDGGLTWESVDSWSPSGKSTSARAIVARDSANIFVGGYSLPDPWVWIIRHSVNGGDTWKTIYTGPPAEINGHLNDMVLDPFGNLYAGGIVDSWTILKRSFDGVWSDIKYPSSELKRAQALAADRAGNIYSTGLAAFPDSDPGRIMAVQTLPPPPRPGPLQIQRSGDAVTLIWPSEPLAILEQSDNPSSRNWSSGTLDVINQGAQTSVTLPVDSRQMYFRLRAF